MTDNQIIYENITEIIKEKYPHITTRLIREVKTKDVRHLCLDNSFKRVVFSRVSLVGVTLIDDGNKIISESAILLYFKQCNICKMLYYKIIGRDAGCLPKIISPTSLSMSNFAYDINHPTTINNN